MAKMHVNDELMQYLMSRVSFENDCWLWTGFLNPDGYGTFYFNDDYGRVHRAAYEYFYGKIPAKLVVDHLCMVRNCFNPAHLEAVTDRVNILRSNGPAALNARRTHCSNGHEYTAENTYTLGNKRYCRQCVRVKNRAWKAKHDYNRKYNDRIATLTTKQKETL